MTSNVFNENKRNGAKRKVRKWCVHVYHSHTLKGVGAWTESASDSGSGVASPIHLEESAQDAERCGIDVVNLLLKTPS